MFQIRTVYLGEDPYNVSALKLHKIGFVKIASLTPLNDNLKYNSNYDFSGALEVLNLVEAFS